MRIGSCIGPYKGMFWLDIEHRILTVRKGRKGVVGEVTLHLSPDKVAEIIDAMIPNDVGRSSNEFSKESKQKVVSLESGKNSSRKSKL